jgi:hypothetical protein
MAPLRPESPYGQSKLMGEHMLRWYGETGALRWMSLRYFNASGASFDAAIGEDFAQSLNLVPLVMKATLGLRPAVVVFGTDFPTPDGTAIRDYIHVEDLADGHLKALDHLGRGGPSDSVNLGTGTGTSVRAVIDMTERVTGRTVPVEYSDRRPGDPSAVWADTHHAAAVLGWTPKYGLTEIIESAWRWHSTRPVAMPGPDRAVRIGFMMDQVAGHITNYRNLVASPRPTVRSPRRGTRSARTAPMGGWNACANDGSDSCRATSPGTPGRPSSCAPGCERARTTRSTATSELACSSPVASPARRR